MSKYGMSDAQATEAQMKMEHTAAGEGLEFHLVGGVTGNTFDAHRLVQLAQLRGVQGQMVERLFRAHFTEQRSIFDHASLQGLAVEAGIAANRFPVAALLPAATHGDSVYLALSSWNHKGHQEHQDVCRLFVIFVIFVVGISACRFRAYTR